MATWLVLLPCAGWIGFLYKTRNDPHLFEHTLQPWGIITVTVGGCLMLVPIIVKAVGKIAAGLENALISPGILISAILAIDMGSYFAAYGLKFSDHDWMVANILGYTIGVTISFLIPFFFLEYPKSTWTNIIVGLRWGIMGSVLQYFVIAVLMCSFSYTSLAFGETITPIRTWSVLYMSWPVFLLVLLLLLWSHFHQTSFINSFLTFGTGISSLYKLTFATAVIFFLITPLLPDNATSEWPFDEIIVTADKAMPWKAVEIGASIMFYVTGMVFWIRLLMQSNRLSSIVQEFFEFDNAESVPILFSFFLNVALVTGSEFDKVSSHDQVLLAAFTPLGSFSLGDHFAYCMTFTPSMLGYYVISKFIFGLALLKYVAYSTRSAREVTRVEIQLTNIGTAIEDDINASSNSLPIRKLSVGSRNSQIKFIRKPSHDFVNNSSRLPTINESELSQ